MQLVHLDRIVALHQVSRVVNFVRNALSCRTQDTDAKFGKIVPIDPLNRMTHQEIEYNWIDPKLGANALEQPAEIMRGDARTLTMSSLAFSEYPNERLPQL